MKRHLVKMIIGLNLINTVLQVINYDYLLTHKHENANFEVEIATMKARYAVQSILLAPSIMSIIAYQANLILALASVLIIAFHRDVETALIEEIFIGHLLVIIVSITLFTVLHRRELKRFRQQQEIEKNKEQF